MIRQFGWCHKSSNVLRYTLESDAGFCSPHQTIYNITVTDLEFALFPDKNSYIYIYILYIPPSEQTDIRNTFLSMLLSRFFQSKVVTSNGIAIYGKFMM